MFVCTECTTHKSTPKERMSGGQRRVLCGFLWSTHRRSLKRVKSQKCYISLHFRTRSQFYRGRCWPTSSSRAFTRRHCIWDTFYFLHKKSTNNGQAACFIIRLLFWFLSGSVFICQTQPTRLYSVCWCSVWVSGWESWMGRYIKSRQLSDCYLDCCLILNLSDSTKISTNTERW